MKRREALRELRLAHVGVGALMLAVPASAAALADGTHATSAPGQQTAGTAQQAPRADIRLPSRAPARHAPARIRVKHRAKVKHRTRVKHHTKGGAVSRAGRVTTFRPGLASWYQDAGGTACGFHAHYGVASLSLPCGATVRFAYGGRTVTAVVDDRGPYVGGRTWDLNQNTAAALGMGGVATVWSSS
jgi:rare lipoprotein A (peptidoglycan hydrolase)